MNRKIFLIAVLVLLLDQISKIIVNILNIKNLIIIKNFFTITLTNNYGIAWSLLQNHAYLIIFLNIIALFIIIRFMFTIKKDPITNISFGLLLGGLAGNLIDRLFLGYVRDFLAFTLFNYNFPIFNIADTCITIGVILLIITILKGEKKDGTV